jgi:ParB/RepB/Spo0J family partition protein
MFFQEIKMSYLEKKLRYLDPNLIGFDIHNPRGETEQQIVTDGHFDRLVLSIREYGVLEPLIVRKNGADGKEFVLVDGERRLRAALEVDLKEVPALVAKDEINGRIIAYQVHKLRKDWSKKIETKSIKIIIQEIQEGHPGIPEIDLRKKIREITNSSPQEIRELLQLLKYDDDVIEEVIEEKSKLQMSHLIQIEQSFMPKLKNNFPEILKTYEENGIRHILARKAAKGLLGDTTRYLMETFKDVLEDQGHHDEIKNLLIRFLTQINEDIEKTYEDFQEIIRPETQENKETTHQKQKTKNTKKKPRSRKTRVPQELVTGKELKRSESSLIENHLFDVILHYLKDGITVFQKRTNFSITDEYKLQDYVYSLLRCLFASVEYEDPSEKLCGKSDRKDFVIKDHNIIVETKYIRDKRHAKTVTDELSADFPRYRQSKYGKTIINYIYDPNEHIDNHNLFLEQLRKLLPEARHYVQ